MRGLLKKSQRVIPTKKRKKEKEIENGTACICTDFLKQSSRWGGRGTVLVEWCAYSGSYILLELFWHSDLLFMQLLKILTYLWKLVLVNWKDYSKIISMVFLIYLIHIIFVRKLAQVFTENLTSNVFESKSEGKL